MPIEFEDLLFYARSLKFSDRPDYNFIKKMFDAVIFRAQYADFHFDWKIIHQKEAVMNQLHKEKVFMKTEIEEGRRRYDPDLFRREAKKIEADFKLPPITPPPQAIHPSDIDLLLKSRDGLLRSEIATVAPGDKPDHIAPEELKRVPEDNLSQLSIAKSFRNRRRGLMDEQEEEEGEEGEMDTRAIIDKMGKKEVSKQMEDEEGDDEEVEEEEEEELEEVKQPSRPPSKGIKPMEVIGPRQKAALAEIDRMEQEKQLVKDLHKQLQDLHKEMLLGKMGQA